MIWFDEMTAHTVPVQIYHHAEECETDADWKTVADSSGSLAVPTTNVLFVRETYILEKAELLVLLAAKMSKYWALA